MVSNRLIPQRERPYVQRDAFLVEGDPSLRDIFAAIMDVQTHGYGEVNIKFHDRRVEIYYVTKAYKPQHN